jgi:UDPglucose--hexose-1-phosphate uridylyltransferase
MSELRYNPLDATWVLIAEERGMRPNDFLPVRTEVVDRGESPCPFCLVQRGEGPARILGEYRAGDDRAIAVANLFPCLRIETPLDRHAVGPWDVAGGLGAHEVVIETRAHTRSFEDLSPAAAANVLRLWRDRARDLERDRRMRWVSVFRNEGREAGATLEHAHSQLLATPVWPERLARAFAAQRDHHATKERCLSCDILRFEREAGVRVVAGDGDFVALCPYAARHAFEVWVMPTTHGAFFTRLGDAAAVTLARLLQRVLRLLGQATLGAPVNLSVQTAPNPDALGGPSTVGLEAFWHWRIELTPRTHRYGGFELGTGMVVNPTAPEAAAAHLRKLDARSGG